MAEANRENGRVLSFQEGAERRERSKSLQLDLKNRINELVQYRDTVAQQLTSVFDGNERQAIRDRLQKLSDMTLRGAELLGTQETEKIQAFLAEDYQALK